jgi:peptidyl-prolyl cis-trans isomerase SurA
VVTQTLKRFVSIVVSTIGTCALVAGCSPREQVVATVGKDPITLGDYELMYAKSNGSREAGAAATIEDRQKFLDLMVKYRLKLADARKEGLDKRPEIMNEIEQYKGSLAGSYLTEHKVMRPGLERLYARRNEEIRARHILIALTPGAPAADSVAAYVRAKEIIDSLKAGKDFGELATTYSQDPSVKQNRGDLYYFTAGQMVAPFEDAAFAMKPGETTTTPVRTQYGLHIIQVTERRVAPGEVHCSHIMMRFTGPNPSPEDTLAAYAKIRALQDSIARGTDFAALAKRNSEDPGSAGRGGDLGWFTRRRYIPSFDEPALALKEGEVSGIVRTPFGYHLIKCNERRPRKTFDESKQELQQIYQQLRFQEDYGKFLATVKAEVGYTRNDSVMKAVIASCDSLKSTRDSAWYGGITPALGRRVMMTVAGTPVTVDSVIAVMRARPDLGNVALRAIALVPAFDKVAEQLIYVARAKSLEREDPEFASILREYREGILLYQIEQERVWNKITANDSTMHAYFDAHRDRFMYPDRLNFTEGRALTEANAMKVFDKVSGGMSLEALTAVDSVRMTAPTSTVLRFAKGSATLTAALSKMLAQSGEELQRDGGVRLIVTAYADTLANPAKNKQLAEKRVAAIAGLVTKKYGAASTRVTTTTRLMGIAASAKDSVARDRAQRVDVMVTDRQALISGKLETSLLPKDADERTKKADSLAVGTLARPFAYKNGFALIRLNGREPARQKTYDEAFAELSSAYQDAESKRLEGVWMDGLRKEFPVVENREVLKNAFAPSK